MKILLTAPPRTGKSTIVTKLAERLPREQLSGFISAERRDAEGEREGFVFCEVGGERELPFAHTTNIASDIQVGRYKVDVSKIDEVVTWIKDTPVLLIDEIGPMEAYSPIFIECMQQLFTVPQKNRLLVVTITPLEVAFPQPFKERIDTILVEVTFENRDVVPKILEALYQYQTWYRELTKSQQEYFNQQLKNYLKNNHRTMAMKIIDNSIGYALGYGGEVQPVAEGFDVVGKHGKYHIRNNTCTCDLFNHHGEFADEPLHDCSHLQAVKLYQIGEGSDR